MERVSTLDNSVPPGGFISDSDSNQALVAFTASLAFHVATALFLTYIVDLNSVSEQDVPMEIVFIEPKVGRGFTDSPPSKTEPIHEDKKEKHFQSNNTHRTHLETFKKRNRIAPSSTFQSGGSRGQAKTTQEEQKNHESGELSYSENRKPLQLPGMGDTDIQSLIPTYVQQRMPPGVRLGNITSLNTDQNRYYSFNRRVAARFIPLWGEKARRAFRQWLQNNNPSPISKTWVTNIEVILNAKGEVLDVQPFRLSDSWAIDSAAIDSFKELNTVPNPPREMVDENGYIHLQYQTTVHWIPQPGIRYHSNGN